MIGIIGAMQEEIESLIPFVEIKNRSVTAHIEFIEGTLNGKEVVVAYSGIGKVQSSVCATLMIEKYKVEKIIFSGVAGGLNPKIPVGGVIIGAKLLQHDFDCTGFGYELGVIPRAKASIFYSDKKLVEIASNFLKKQEAKFMVGTIVSGDQFICEKEKALSLIKIFGADAAEMEGAAVAHVATLYDVPFVVVRLISDNANEEAKVDYSTFIKGAIILANNIVKNIVENL